MPTAEADNRTIEMKPQQEPSTQEVLAGLVERVTFHNDESGFCVLRIKARGHRELVTVARRPSGWHTKGKGDEYGCRVQHQVPEVRIRRRNVWAMGVLSGRRRPDQRLRSPEPM